MSEWWRNPVLAAGVVLLTVGGGNWLVSRSKLIEYSQRSAALPPIEDPAHLESFPFLTRQTNEALLARLHRGYADTTVVDGKLDFYKVVHTGGRILTFTGALLIGLA